MHANIYKKIAYKKVLFSLMVVFIYILGTNLVIPGINVEGLYQTLTNSANAGLVLSMTGLSLSQISLFSLGLGPWMSALIFWRVLTVTNLFHIKTLTNAQSYRIKFIFSLLLASIQSFTILAQAQTYDQSTAIPSAALILILVAGMSILIWLGNLNSQHGIGGPTIIILVSILRNWPSNIISETVTRGWIGTLTTLVPGILLLLLGSYFVFRFYQGERRLPMHHVMMDDEAASKAYLPIPTNPAGGMPFMFAFSIVLLPQYVIYFLKKQYDSKFLEQLYQEIQLDHLLGVSLLILSLVLLTYGFSYVNIDYKELSESLKKSGDYFSNVYPGKNTERFLFRQVSLMATIAAFTNAVIIGLPMILAIYFPEVSMWAYLIPTWMILIILIKEIRIQFSSLYHRNDYKVFL
ncbi:accessory Sec system protein translocase subunit SecY2 [Lactococcus formosensis]|uniref:accessory Sec system protein translocase subunit SecY2 n=1 Tax=Lactococcus formosensis TaxID=1281486 RepID=UPI002097908E|nr:accessory Sec system protein translocase subunit SecY2 [Lactococcus formosensis]MCO7181488.1 accessory Sec system protein translocase subunit SecY2 [Lactococcus formosensis]